MVVNDFWYLQEKVAKVCQERGWDTESPQQLVLIATEELGEVARAVLLNYCPSYIPGNPKKRRIEESDTATEIGDLIFTLLALCNTLDMYPILKHIK